tara:strand:+ start:69 stop:446 length:378 start_codon:yes stop_codon:yes gene_type:complete
VSKSIEVIVVDPFAETITKKEISDNESPEEFSKMLNCDAFDVVRLGDDVIMYIDDNGLLHETNRYFKLESETASYTYAGIGILACDDGEGGTVSFDKDIKNVEKLIEFMPEGHKEEPFMKFVPIN